MTFGMVINPLRGLKDLLLYAIGAYIVTKISFPPNDPPPNFPFLFPFTYSEGNHKDNMVEIKENNI